MSINLTDGMSTSGGMSMSPQIFSGSMEFTLGQINQLSPASTQFDLIGDFTIEAWVYPTSYPYGGWTIFDARVNGSSATPWEVFLTDTGNLGFFDGSSYAGTGVAELNVWTHVAYVRYGSDFNFYINGVLDTTFTIGTGPISPGLTQPVVGSKDIYVGPYGTVGNISNLRIVVGVAVYTSAFTPSTSPLTVVQPANFNGSPSSAITGNQTVLLLNTDYNGFNFLDRSQNNFTLIGPDMPLPSNLSPFIGSMLFNGTSDYLNVPSNPALGFGTEDFTVECWVNWTALSTSAIFNNQTNGGFNLYYDAGTYLSNYLVVSNRYVNQIAYSWTPTIDTWYHIAISRFGTDLRMFIDGTLVTTTTGDTTDYQAGDYDIGSDQGAGGWYLNGNLSNLRVTKGVAVYTSNFIVPSNVLTSVQGANVNGFPSSAISSTQTSLLLSTPNNNNSYLVDSSIYQNIILSSIMPQPNGFNPLGFSGSLLVNGTDQYLTVSGPIGPQGTEDYTLEFWTYQPSYSYGNYPRLFQGSSGQGFNSNWVGSILQLAFFPSIDMTDYAGQWVHVATTRQGTTAYAFLNGQLVDTNYTADAYLEPGDGNWTLFYPEGGGPAGNFSNFRIVRGVAVYTTNFVVSRNPLTATQSSNQNGFPSAAITGTQTSLLLNTNNNSTYLDDSSSYHYTINAFGSPVSSDMQPNFMVNGSSLFNGTSDYLTVASNPAFAFGTGDFTIETWSYLTKNDGQYISIAYLDTLSIRYGDSGFGNLLQVTLNWAVESEIWSCDLSQTTNLNTWVHIAFTRESGVCRLFVNGVLQNINRNANPSSFPYTSFTDSTNIPGSTNFNIGVSPTIDGFWQGYFSNLRVVNGIAVYTTDFTLPTAPLTATQTANTNGNPSAAITGTETSLLLNTFNSGLNRVDSSSYNFLVTSPNTPAPDNSAPSFVSEGSFLSNGYQYLQIPHSSYGNLFDQDGAFTIECWFYQTSHNPYGTFVWCQDVNFGDTWRCFYSNGYFGCWNYVGASITSAPIFGDLNTWYHIALSSDGTTTRLFVNGTFQGSYAGTGIALTQDMPFQVAWGNYNGPYSYGIYGNISNFRFVKGVAVYTTAFTPPSNDLTVTQNANTNGYPSAAITGYQTSLLLNTTNDVLNHLDSSTHQLLVTTPPTPIPAAWNPYNLGSILFHDGCYLQTNSTVFNFDTNDFTIETWAYWATAKTGNETIFEGTGPTRLIFGISDTGVRLYMYDGSGGEFGCSYAFSVDTWYHIAVVRLGGNISIYVNGTLANTPFVDSKVWAFTLETIGRNNDGVEIYYGNISNLRITNGVGVYTGNFTTPTQPLSVSQNAGTNINPVTPYQTSLLLNTIDSPNNLLDSSIYNLTLSIAGTPTAVINNPFGPL